MLGMVIGVALVGVTTVALVGAFIGVAIITDVLTYASGDFGLLRALKTGNASRRFQLMLGASLTFAVFSTHRKLTSASRDAPRVLPDGLSDSPDGPTDAPHAHSDQRG
jgi:hypothetical protein